MVANAQLDCRPAGLECAPAAAYPHACARTSINRSETDGETCLVAGCWSPCCCVLGSFHSFDWFHRWRSVVCVGVFSLEEAAEAEEGGEGGGEGDLRRYYLVPVRAALSLFLRCSPPLVHVQARPPSSVGVPPFSLLCSSPFPPHPSQVMTGELDAHVCAAPQFV